MASPGFKPQAAVAARRARVLQLRIEQRTYAEIAELLDIPIPTAKSDYQRAFAALKAQQDASAADLRELELAKLDAWEREAWRVLRRKHVTVQHGKIVGKWTGRYLTDPETSAVLRDDDGRPLREYEDLEDDAPVLAALDRLDRIARRRAALRGLDAPVRVEVDDARLAAIRAVAERLAARRVGDVEPGGAGSAAEDPPGAGPGGEAV